MSAPAAGPSRGEEAGLDHAGNWRGESVIGWRVWRLRPDGLRSWAAKCYWTPGLNSAICLTTNPCPAPPGQACRCGFWALHSPTRCLQLARRDPVEGMTVVGLVQAWGEVALHGEEGFRAANASVVALFTDWVWGAEREPRSRAERWWRGFVHSLGFKSFPRGTQPDPNRKQLVISVGGRYGVPVLSLRDAFQSGFLGEMGVDKARREEVRCLIANSSTAEDGSQTHRTADHGSATRPKGAR